MDCNNWREERNNNLRKELEKVFDNQSVMRILIVDTMTPVSPSTPEAVVILESKPKSHFKYVRYDELEKVADIFQSKRITVSTWEQPNQLRIYIHDASFDPYINHNDGHIPIFNSDHLMAGYMEY